MGKMNFLGLLAFILVGGLGLFSWAASPNSAAIATLHEGDLAKALAANAPLVNKEPAPVRALQARGVAAKPANSPAPVLLAQSTPKSTDAIELPSDPAAATSADIKQEDPTGERAPGSDEFAVIDLIDLEPPPRVPDNYLTGDSFSAAQGLVSEKEPNDTFATASPLGSINVVATGNIFPNADVDFWSFTAAAGDRVYAAVQTGFSSPSDSVLNLLASDGTTVLESDDDDGAFESLSSGIAGTTIPSAGTYYLKVIPFSAARQIRPYFLHFRLQSGSPTAGTEPNDTPATATPLPANGWVSGARGTTTDLDYYSLSLNAGDTVFLSLDLDPERDLLPAGAAPGGWNGRLGIALFGDAANQILTADGGSSVFGSGVAVSESLFMTVKTAGTYYAYVDSAFAIGGATFTYHLSVSVHPPTPIGTNCTVYTSTDVPKTIAIEPGTTDSTIVVPGSPRIEDLNVSITLTHALMADLDAALLSPAGNENSLFTDIGAGATGGQNQMDLDLDDEAGIPPLLTVLKGPGYQPESSYRLGWFKGESAGGTWTLRLRDDLASNGGTLSAWSITICEPPAQAVCSGTQVTVHSSDFESGTQGYTHSGTADEWARGNPTFAPVTGCNSGTNCWKTDLTGTYDVSSNQDLVSPTISLSGLAAPVRVSWAQKYQMDGGTTLLAASFFAEIRNPGPTNATTLFQYLDGTMTDSVGNPATTINESAGWGLVRRNIDAYANQNIQLRWNLTSDAAVTNLAGLAIDDVTVTACCTAASCNDGNPCTDDSCIPATGCVHTYNTSACTDDNPCTIGDVCAGGVCVPGTAALPAPVQFCNAAGIAILSTVAPTKASPYPSTISVATEGSHLCSVTVNLNGITHDFKDDIDVLLEHLVGPSAIIMSDAGDPSAPHTNPVDLTLSDDALAPLPATQLFSGTFMPTNVTGVGSEIWPAPAPPPPAAPGSALSTFIGRNPNGPWNLWVVDDFSVDSGSMSGWCVNLVSVCIADADCNDDGNSCTNDTCVNAQCTHANNTNACIDGNACTQGDVCGPQFADNFDSVTAPALPTGWTSTVVSGTGNPWVTQSTSFDSAPNSAFGRDGGVVADEVLVSPPIAINSPTATLTFRNRWSFESLLTCFDAGVLEIKIGAGAFTDIVAAGGSFVSGGYTGTVNAGFQNPLAGRAAWCRASTGYPLYLTTSVNLPAAAAGQVIQLRWRVGTDESVFAVGQNIDSIVLGGICGTAIVCNDGNACTDDSCNPASGCVFVNNTATCDDGHACTVGEACTAGNCLAPVSLAQAAGSPVPVGTNPISVAAGDVNGDAKLDLAVANTSSSDATILLGNGSGGFSEAVGSPVSVGASPRSIVLRDWNGDGKLDLAVANRFSDFVTIMLGDGSGGFTPAAGSPVAVGTNPYAVAAGDVNGDGKLDLVVANYGSNSVTILLGNGSGGFSQAASSPVAVGTNPESVAVGDVNGDGKLDLAAANASSNNVTILLGNGSGGFSQAAGSPVTVGTNPEFVAVADLNGDARLDFAVANGSSNDVTILLGNGAGGFSPASGSPVAVGSNPVPIAVGNWNADGKLDLAVANFSSSNLTIFLNSRTSAADGTSCNDGHACTTGDVCSGGACSGTPGPAPAEVDNGVRVARSGGSAVISWNLAAGATSSDVLRGLVSALPVGPGGGDETCLADEVLGTTASDGTVLPAGEGYWYLVRGENVCGNGGYGSQASHGVPTVPRLSGTCP